MSINNDIVSPFDGTINQIYFEIGDSVKEGDVLFSMLVHGVDMDILTPVDGQLHKIEVSLQDHVISGMILASIME